MAFSPILYQHDLDRQAFNALNAFPKFVKLQEAYMENVDEVAAKIDLLSTAIRINDKQFPEIYRLLPPICEQLGISEPDLYYVKSKQINAWTGGNTSAYICVTSRLVNEMPIELISNILAHECGHIACKHSLYHSMAGLLVNGINDSPLARIPAVRRYLSPTLVRALLFWDRCSELSADRAAVLCDGNADRTVDVLLKVHGYKNINREEFLKQSLDLKAFVNDSKSNKLMEMMLTQDETHPRLAIRVCECYEWSKSKCFQGILDGTYTMDSMKKSNDAMKEKEIIAAELTVTPQKSGEACDLDQLNQALQEVNAKLERYTSKADYTDYALAVSSGILAGLIDSLFVGEFVLDDANSWGNEKANRFVFSVAKSQGYQGSSLPGAIQYLEECFPIAADKVTNEFGGGLQHHLRDFSHHPTPVGLICSILTQFTHEVYGTDTAGAFKAVALQEDGLALVGKNLPEKVMFGVVNWAFHLVSDMAGSSGTVRQGRLGTGLPGPVGSLLKELSATPLFQKMDDKGYREFSVQVSKLFNGTLLGRRNANGELIPIKYDLRTELGVVNHIGRQAIPVIVNECIVYAFYFLRQLVTELEEFDCNESEKLNWKNVLPSHSRTLDRMLTVSTMTFTMADTADATIHAALESAGNWVLFSGRFVARFNYVGAGRAALAVIRECSNERQETQLIHEKMLLSEAKTAVFLEKLQNFKEQLEEKVSNYLAEDLESFMEGFDFMERGLENGDSDLFIKGNLVIQRVLGREPQFTNQQDFDDLMMSEIPLQL